jgi:hypothetical protein
MFKRALVWALAGMLACSNAPPGAAIQHTNSETASQPDLVTSLEVTFRGDSVRFLLHLTNNTRQSLRLEFPTSQRYDFVVQRPDGSEVWRWSNGQMFAQHVSSEELKAGETRDYWADWRPGTSNGRFVVIGQITSSARIEQRVAFDIPKR